MFKNRELKVQVVKTPKQNADATRGASVRMTPEYITSMIRVNAKDAAILIGIGYAAKKVLDTTSEIALMAARSNFK
jgi:hypothetical protein